MTACIKILILSAIVTLGNCQCDTGFIRHDDSCYHIGDDREMWTSAMEFCKLLGGAYLAEITTAKEHAFLVNAVKHISDDFWIGGSDVLVEGEWVWMTSRTPVSYSNWQAGEPSSRDLENCMELTHGFWNDAPCTVTQHYICERPIDGFEIVGK